MTIGSAPSRMNPACAAVAEHAVGHRARRPIDLDAARLRLALRGQPASAFGRSAAPSHARASERATDTRARTTNAAGSPSSPLPRRARGRCAPWPTPTARRPARRT
jgi:hypothetical protein